MPITTRLTIARHGQARCNVDGRVGGPRTCTGLTDHGRHQVELLAGRLAAQQHTGPAFDVLYAGSRLRLQESGRILANALGLTLVTELGLDGPRHGQADGQLWRDIESAFGGAPHTHPDQPYAPGSDTWNRYLTRATNHLAALIERHQGQSILLAAHSETTHAACHLLLNIAPQGHVPRGLRHRPCWPDTPRAPRRPLRTRHLGPRRPQRHRTPHQSRLTTSVRRV
ncbi:histidine phosphatase family protein [Streptomyces coeruleofuscus]|uniref:histidine phosphatase family protein n=1 Tax=Streptomyces coeruleofuscus TaxID=66879 RepID=UPI0031FA3068